jgi:hypothetical protein
MHQGCSPLLGCNSMRGRSGEDHDGAGQRSFRPVLSLCIISRLEKPDSAVINDREERQLRCLRIVESGEAAMEGSRWIDFEPRPKVGSLAHLKH